MKVSAFCSLGLKTEVLIIAHVTLLLAFIVVKSAADNCSDEMPYLTFGTFIHL
jgi:hypothetical protein